MIPISPIYREVTNQNIVRIDDAKGGAGIDLTAQINPVQDLHGFDAPWVGGAGKNKWNERGIGYYASATGNWTTTGTATYYRGTYKFSATPGDKWVVSTTSNVNVCYICKWNGDTWISATAIAHSGPYNGRYYYAFTVPENVDTIAFNINCNNTTTVQTVTDMMLESGTLPTSYAPYSNICQISGWTGANVTRTGKNLFNINGTDESKGYVNGKYLNVSGVEKTASSGWYISEYIRVQPNTQYVLSGVQKTTSTVVYTCEYNGQKEFVASHGHVETSITFVTDSTTKYIRITNNGTGSSAQFEEGTTASVYEAYQGNTYAIEFPDAAGTVYGGTLTINKDGTGALVTDWIMYDEAASGWGYAASQHVFIKTVRTYTDCIPICNMYKGVTSAEANSGAYAKGNGTICVRYPTTDRIYIRDDRYTNANDFMNAISGIQIMFKLATPVTYNLTAETIESLLGINNIYADTGNINYLKYEADDSVYYDAIKHGNLTHARMTFLGQNIVLEDEDIYVNAGININDMLNGDTDLVFGKAVCKQMTTTLLNTSKLDGLKWTSEFTLEFGVEIDGTTQWVNVGYFSGEKPNNVTSVETISFTAYDRMRKFDVMADDFVKGLTYPKTVAEIYSELCAYVGLTKVAGDELSAIMSRSYAEAPVDMEGYTCRDILAWIAEACGCYARINADGCVQMVWFADNTDYAITADDEYHIESGDINDGMTWDEADELTWDEIDEMSWNDVCGYQETYSVDQLMVKQVGSDLEANYPYACGGNVYMIVDNPFLAFGSTADIETYIAPIYNRLKTFGGYMPAKVECVGNWCVEAGDIITVDLKEETLSVPIFIRTMMWRGSVMDSYEVTGQNQRATYTSEANKQKVLNSKEIKMVVGDNYYERQNGIVINEDGVAITGNKGISLDSYGEISIKAHHYDTWTFDSEGLVFEGHAVMSDTPSLSNYIKFGISPWTGEQILLTESGISPEFDENCNYVNMLFKVWKHRANASLSIPEEAYLRLDTIDSYDPQEGYDDEGSMVCLYTDATPDSWAGGWLGQSTNMWRRIYGEYVYYYFLEQVSSREYKDNIEPLKDYGDAIDKLNPVSFMYKSESKKRKKDGSGGKTSYGLVYEDTINVLPEICNGNKDQKAINYMSLIPILLKEVQSLRKRVAELESIVKKESKEEK